MSPEFAVLLLYRTPDHPNFRVECNIRIKSGSGNHVTFESLKFLAPRVGRVYCLPIVSQEGEPLVFREVEFAAATEKEPPYIYRATLREKLSGAVEFEESNESAEGDKA